jgi:hypothetical protein
MNLMLKYFTLFARILGNTTHYVGKKYSSSLSRVGDVCSRYTRTATAMVLQLRKYLH